MKVINQILDVGVVAVVRAESSEQALKISDACLKGGVTAIEMTFTVPGAVEVIKDLVKTYQNGEMIIGAGTVLDAETARAAILAGAQFIVSPSLNFDTIKLCNRYQIPVMPGTATVKDIVEAMEAGVDIVKAFPGESLGTKFIKAVKGPLPQANIMPTGGVSLENAAEWIQAGCVAVGVGGSLTAGAKTGDYQSITDKAKKFVEVVRTARGK
ncbi:2-dehydro-3-deoxyphosphogluconate aldolase/(4S)-4-hydroxy-2-oxoglutarate aldolase [Sporomusaceae bacterium BoRhaA]|uniref:bifunctional 2-keto-4-hydroxyglutarate aldolase/2-keto-3-deoxy-6-phosphogluconate aldolase n=1 Tax=Pelorhabdus rhamnosifermentans TaxID=2772457 RepID=UPI001C05F3F6|nr:bifunctional 2-keto-4-hydroxyglutarate aldolase/2-keto-3-deoxy-6-phosphogluconate aldolase [Pelorhabdus rhamnosifermentans]MBU2699248.1 2-dehydro-3-deoxyphosphogluconate aldolase/(4S)-4-hydroxy-2-oxoglutarate aldolase [Pelorhabdus rhamnosifermentans]